MLEYIYPCINAVLHLNNIQGHANEGRKQGTAVQPSALQTTHWLSRKCSLTQPKQVMEARVARQSSLLLLFISQLLLCFVSFGPQWRARPLVRPMAVVFVAVVEILSYP